MGRNKYPEITVERILDVSRRLFLEKGYDNTTIQDIVDELGGLTKGAIYHHFKSKEEILNALSNKLFLDNNPFSAVRDRTDLNGLQKIQEAMRLNQEDSERSALSSQAIPMLENPRILSGLMESNRNYLSPMLLELIEEGKKDGSIKTEYAKELSELFPLLELWLMPSLYPATESEMIHKLKFIQELFEQMGMPVFDERSVRMIRQWFQKGKKK
ncbi:MAG: TetR/AcrR family transcriptional regulator [Lachnospiraceae bacterium]|nr:TetR/AcrR family transcriptional regulator [Lachnospiraceae bacterium]